MTFGEFQQLPYPPDIPMEYALVGALYEGKIDLNEILLAYTRAIEKERNESKMLFEEACLCMTQHLCGNFKGKDKEEADKRMIHCYNKTKTLVPHAYDEKHGYTAEDEKRFNDLWRTIYHGLDL